MSCLHRALTRGKGGMAPALVTARTGAADYAFLDIAKPAFDFSDRGVEGRASPGPLDAFPLHRARCLSPRRHGSCLGPPAQPAANAVSDIPLTFIFSRPDGVEHRRMRSRDQGLGGHNVDLALQATVMQGTWQVAAYADPKAAPIAEVQFLVEDFVPDSHRVRFAGCNTKPARAGSV